MRNIRRNKEANKEEDRGRFLYDMKHLGGIFDPTGVNTTERRRRRAALHRGWAERRGLWFARVRKTMFAHGVHHESSSCGACGYGVVSGWAFGLLGLGHAVAQVPPGSFERDVLRSACRASMQR